MEHAGDAGDTKSQYDAPNSYIREDMANIQKCNAPGVCNTCLTSGFRVWPSALGCRRGDLECFAFGVLPRKLRTPAAKKRMGTRHLRKKIQ